MASMTLAFTYPVMKRITYWPQFFLGLTFNWGIIMAWASLSGYLAADIFLVYFAAIFWTLGYDTIYGAQDIADDEVIGLKSTSIKFKKNIKFFVCISYLITSALLIILFFEKIGINMFSFLLLLFVVSLIYQVINFNKNAPKTCLKTFKFNNYSGLLLFLSFLAA